MRNGTAKGRTNIELREQFILADGVSQSMAAFTSRRSTPNAAQTSANSSHNGGAGSPNVPPYMSGQGPIIKVNHKKQITKKKKKTKRGLTKEKKKRETLSRIYPILFPNSHSRILLLKLRNYAIKNFEELFVLFCNLIKVYFDLNKYLQCYFDFIKYLQESYFDFIKYFLYTPNLKFFIAYCLFRGFAEVSREIRFGFIVCVVDKRIARCCCRCRCRRRRLLIFVHENF